MYCGKIYHSSMTDDEHSWSRKPAHKKCPVKRKWLPGGYALLENHLMGYSLRSDRYRLVAWLDERDVNSKPLYLELYDHKKDPKETQNLAGALPTKVNELLKQVRLSGIGSK